MKCLSKKKPMQMVWERFWHPELKYHNPLTSSDSTLWGSGHPKPEWHNPSTFSDSTLSGPGHKDGLCVYTNKCFMCLKTNRKQLQQPQQRNRVA